jgi:hypothetical protein
MLWNSPKTRLYGLSAIIAEKQAFSFALYWTITLKARGKGGWETSKYISFFKENRQNDKLFILLGFYR